MNVSSTDPRIQLVGAGYDAVIDTWEAWSAQIDDDLRHSWAADLATRLPEGGRVLELGCGGGTRETALLASRFDVTGIDLSERQLERARERVPNATFVHGDLTSVDHAPASFDAVVAFYVFNHVPRELLPPLLRRIHSWLRMPGWLMAAFGTLDEAGWTGEFLGAPTFFSSHSPDVNSALVRDAGFGLERDEVVEIAEPEGAVPFQWILAARR
jgi:cyclopropane fatty-acyl-phospholipid synthase-like methyltransferase